MRIPKILILKIQKGFLSDIVHLSYLYNAFMKIRKLCEACGQNKIVSNISLSYREIQTANYKILEKYRSGAVKLAPFQLFNAY